MPVTPPPSPGILATIAAAFRRNRLPCALLNVLVVALVTSYYRWPAVAGMWEEIGALKVRWSFAFSLASTIFAAVLMPSLVQAAMGTLPADGRLRRLLFLMVFWGYRGMEIDLFFRVQGMMFGHGNDAATLVKKLLVDQLVYGPLWAVPTYIIALRWEELGFSWARTKASLDREFWTRTCPMVMITNWLIWIPALVCVYSLPPALQFPLFSVVMCFFVLVVTVMAKGNRG